MTEVALSAGALEYEDTGGRGPVLVFTHGLLMDGSLWRHVVPGLRDDYRCITLTLPLGGHRRPMRSDADLSLRGMALLIEEFLEVLDLHEVTLIQNDWGGAQVLLAHTRAARITRLVITACEAFDNYPPRPVRPIVLAARIPGGLALLMTALRLRFVRAAPGSWGWMSKHGVPAEVMDRWFAPATSNPAVRRDLAKYVVSVPPKATLLEWASRSAEFGGSVLVVWAAEDKMMPRDHGRRLADLFADSRLVEVEDSYTLIPEDQPDLLIDAIRRFLSETRGRLGS